MEMPPDDFETEKHLFGVTSLALEIRIEFFELKGFSYFFNLAGDGVIWRVI